MIMNESRELYEKEKYFRKINDSVNITDGDYAYLKPLEKNQIYYISSLDLTIAGADLLTNYHKFGNLDGLLELQCWSKDKMIVNDKFSMHPISLNTSGDWKRGEHFLTHSIDMLKDPGRESDQGVLSTKKYVPKISMSNTRADFGTPSSIPYWVSEPINLDSSNDEIVAVGWEAENSHTENRTILHNYRIDLEYSLDRSQTPTKTVSLTHWDLTGSTPNAPTEVPEPSALTPPAGEDITLGRPRTGFPETGPRFIPISMSDVKSLKVKVYFDRTDPEIFEPSHRVQLFDRLPKIRDITIYTKDKQILDGTVADKNKGRNNYGVFSSFRHLVDFSYGINWSAERSFEGVDIAHLELPISVKLSEKFDEHLKVNFTGPGINFLEIKARAGRVFYEEEQT